MRICLFWNENAGEGISLDEVTATIVRAGHTVERVVQRPADLPSPLETLIECVVAAGGDGTVARAARALAGGPVPLAILPLGTANNIADSLGIRGAPEDLIRAWCHQRIVRIDTGGVEDASGRSTFLESAGVGLIADGIAAGDSAIPKGADVTSQLAHARQLYVDAVRQMLPKHYAITVDGEKIDGDYLLVEVLNIPSVGPNVRLTPEVSAADGLLSVVVAGESDRDALVKYLASPNGEGHDAGLKSWRATRVELSGAHVLHVDDELREAVEDAVTISIQPASLAVLA